jgi:glycosyltransferase involved in cell wall biosynthesis
MKLSIIIPTYNRMNLLKNILSNLINQTEKNFEILVVDDNSKDKTKGEIKILEKENKFIKYYKNK